MDFQEPVPVKYNLIFFITTDVILQMKNFFALYGHQYQWLILNQNI